MTKWLGCLAMAAGITMILMAVLLLFHNQAEDIQAGQAAQAVLAKLERSQEDGAPSEPIMDAPTKEVDGKAYLGVLSIPALSLELPVMDQWSYENLKIAPCRYSGSYVTQDFVIAGHSYARHFGNLAQLQVGDWVIFTDVANRVHVYQVERRETLAPDQVEQMVDSGYDLTLFTCTYDSRNRTALRCNQASAESLIQ